MSKLEIKQTFIVLILLSLLAFAGCKTGTDKSKELELKEKELALKEKELELKKKGSKKDDSDNEEESEDDSAKVVETKKKKEKKAVKKVAPPAGSTTETINASGVAIRNAPSLSGKKIGVLRKGEKVYVIGQTVNMDEWKGAQYPWKNVQLQNGKKGWVLGAFFYDLHD